MLTKDTIFQVKDEDFISHDTAGSMSTSILVSVPLAPGFTGSCDMGLNGHFMSSGLVTPEEQ